jgi:hypothetical protein
MSPPKGTKKERPTMTDNERVPFEVERASMAVGALQAAAVLMRDGHALERALLIAHGMDVLSKMVDDARAAESREAKRCRDALEKVSHLNARLITEMAERVKFERWYNAQAQSALDYQKRHEAQLRRLRAKHKAKLAEAVKSLRPSNND